MQHIHGHERGAHSAHVDATSYTCVVLNCASDSYNKAKEIATQSYRDQVKFSALSISTSYFKIPYGQSETTTFCSKLIADICQKANIISPDVCSNYITPSKLHKLLSNLEACRPLTQDLPSGKTAPIDFVGVDCRLIVLK